MAGQLYHSSIYDSARPVPSYWEASAPACDLRYQPLEGDAVCEVAIIGGGFTGLSTALHLARDHGIEARVLEAGAIGWGASGRNGGFCGLAATKLSITGMIRRYGLAETQRFYSAQCEGIELVEALAEDEGIDYQRAGDGNYEVAHAPRALADFEDYAQALTRHFGIPTRQLSREAFAAEAHDGREQFGGLHIGLGFALHPLRFCQGLADAAARRGARIHPRSEVTGWERAGGRHRLITATGSLTANQVVLATNAFLPEDLSPRFSGRILPVLSNIITTRPLSEAELTAQSWRTLSPICNSRNLLFYYRLLPDKRFLIGARGDLSGSPSGGETMRVWLTRRLGQILPAWQDVEIEHFWRGLVCMSRKLAPSLGRLEDDPSVWYGYGYHANGVNTAPWTGRLLARLIAGQADPAQDIPHVMAGQAPRFPLPGLRRWAVAGAYLWYRLADDWLP
jgi:glycine/D-amino acid oxidase-like deaminating enzyme